MANENKIGCSAGRAKIIDPNDFDGFKSESNVPVQTEDLNISVVLTSFRKGRTLLTTESSDSGISENVSQISVNFIEGSELGSKKVLTTSYTDLTTRFDSDVVNDETLGITNIDIEFNASFAPLITINFIDVRGSSIFQNEENILNNRGNKYTTFFQLPYPMYELEIKGYYGLPVKYCLHMLKFNSKFNSQTGNFEITANFIGYTFALMSDMLIGYLKAIPFTSIGKEQFDNYNSTISSGVNVLTLSDLSLKISEINSGLNKEANENPASKEINAATQAIEKLDNMKFQINLLGQNFDLNDKKDEYKYIVFNHVDDYSDKQKSALNDNYMQNIKELITDYNKLNPNDKIVEADFTQIESNTNTNGGKKYKSLTLEKLKSDDDQDTADALGNPSNVSALKQTLVSYIAAKNTSVNDTSVIDIFDMTLLYEIIAKKKVSVEVSETESKKKLAKAFEGEVRDILGFDPTARTIIECFTAAIETFVETIYRVSTEAIKNTERTDELAKKFTESDTNITDMKNVFIEKKQFFPWPDYREKDDEKKAYIDKYLGASGVLEMPERVNELVFIDDLLEAFRKAAKKEEEAKDIEEANETTWMSVNPIDTAILQETEPYEREELLTQEDIVRHMVIRGMTFLGYSNDLSVVSDDEIKAMANSEVDNMLRGVKDEVLRQSMTQLKIDYFTNIGGVINGVQRKVVAESNEVYYNYIYTGTTMNGWKIIPTNKGFTKETWGYPSTDKTKNEVLKKELVKKREEDGFLFLTNYGDAPGFYDTDDGGLNVRILSELPNSIPLGYLPEGVKPETDMILANLIGDPDHPDVPPKDAGYNCFNPKYGIQEFETMDWGDDNLKGLPLMYVFYRDCDTGLGLTRKATTNVFKLKKTLGSYYDFKNGDWDKDYLVKIPTTKSEFYYSNGHYDGDSWFGDDSAPVHHNLGKNRLLFNALLNGGQKDNVTYPYIELKYGEPDAPWWSFTTEDEPRKAYTNNSFSLFGSEFYYNQSYAKITNSDGTKISCAEYSKAFLFLQTLPFNTFQQTDSPGGNPFTKNEIKHLFDMKSGIIHAPKLWCAYIGSMLWRMDTNNSLVDSDGKIIGGGVGKWSEGVSSIGGGEPLVWHVDYSNGEINDWNGVYSQKIFKVPMNGPYTEAFIQYPAEYFPPFLDYTRGFGEGTVTTYPPIEDGDTLKTLPAQVKKEFKNIFFDFVNGSGDKNWRGLANKLEIYDTSSDTSGKSFYNYLHAILKKASESEVLSRNEIVTGNIGSTNYNTKEDNIKKYYNIIAPVYQESGSVNDFYLHLELKDGTSLINSLIDAMTEEVFILNNNYKLWSGGLDKTERVGIKVSKPKYELYFNSIIDTLKANADKYNISKKNENIDNQIFGTTNKDIIRLQLYRNCKNIYDKWLGGAKSIDNLVFQCGNGTRSTVDEALAKRYQNSKTRMIDSFRFVTRNFRDIGNELYINPSPINDYLIDNPNSSSYDAISSILGSNNFNFQALPNFVNFNDDKILESIFTPYNYNNGSIQPNSCGPAFVCVYDGQSSKHLALPERDGNYPNDGFDLRCMNGGIDVSVPTDFTSEKYEDYEEPISTFMVRYSQQNQNIFKDIHLDQSEFSETDESIQIQDEISQKGTENNRAIVGQNIYNVYAVRSYTAKVEMMGNAMIQPMMYFQLDNIPMFHGAYMITKVSHSIKPNSMSTNFTGTRIRYPETPLITAYDVYMDLIETLDISEAGSSKVGSGGGSPSYSAPLVKTLQENGATYSNITVGNIKAVPIGDIKGIKFVQVSSKQLLEEAAKPFTEMMKDWVDWMIKEGFKSIDKNGKDDVYAYVTSMFRTNGKASMHALGIAVDLQMYDKNGTQIPNHANNGGRYSEPWYFNFQKNPALKWLYNHSYEYGFVQPYWANDGKGTGDDSEEHWHWEYHGKSAICMLKKQLIPGKGDNKASDNPLSAIDAKKIKDFVKNPKGKDGKEADYGTGCDYKTSAASDKANDINPDMSTTSTKSDTIAAQLEVKKYFKALGLNKQQVAGIMGNIQQETGGTWNPKALNKKDLNGYSSYGLIQWNQKYSSISDIGDTVASQLDYLVNKWTPYNTWVNLGDDKGTKKYSNSAAYEFANIVEVCDQCNKGYQVYANSYQAIRSDYAADFFRRFGDKKDNLYW